MARAEFQTTVLDSDGDVQTSKPVVFYEEDGTTLLAQPLYDANSGGSIVASPQTNSVGQLDLYADTPQYLTYKVNNGTLQYGRLDPDPGQVVLLTATQVLTNKTLTSPTVNGGTLNSIVSADVLGPAHFYGVGAATPNRGFSVNANNQILFLEVSSTTPADLGTNIQIAKSLTLTNSIMVDCLAYVTFSGTTVTPTTGSATGTATGTAAGPPGTLTMNLANWTINDFAGRVVIATNGVLTGYGLIATNTADTLTLNSSWVGTVPGVDWTFIIKSKGDPSNFKMNTYVRDGSVADTRTLEFHTEGSAARGEATLWGIEGGVHPGVATTDGTDKVVCYVARVTPPSAGAGTQPAAPINGDVAFLAIGGSVNGVVGAAGWNYFFKGYNSANTLVYSETGDGYVNAIRGRFGSVSLSTTSPLAVKQSANSQGGGLQLYEAGTSDYFALYMGADENAYIEARPVAGAGSYVYVGGIVGAAGLSINSMNGASLIAEFFANTVSKASINTSGEFLIGGTKVVGAQGAAVADATGAGDVVAQLNTALARLRAHGLIAT